MVHAIDRAPIIDVHAHALPMPLLRALEQDGLADLSGAHDGAIVLDPEVSGLNPGAPIPFSGEHHDVDVRIDVMDAAGVAVQVISMPPFVVAADADDPRALDVVRRGNDALAEFVAGAPHRFVALGTVPVGRPGAADEARRCLDELRCAGLALATSGGGRELDDRINDDLWGYLGSERVFAFVHPAGVSAKARLAPYHLVQLLGFPAETALGVARLVFGGVLDRHDLVLCLAHGGGCLPWLQGRLDLGWRVKPVAHTTLHPPSDYLRRLHYDTAVFDPVLLRRLVHDVGPQHVLVGTDAPFDLADRDPRSTVAALELDTEPAAAMLGGNAQRLLSLQVAGL